MTYVLNDQTVGYPNIEDVVAVPASLSALPLAPGVMYPAIDPVWGPGEFIFARAGGSIRSYGLCVCTPVWDATNLTYTYNVTEVPNTANLGRMLAVNQAGALTTGQYGWFQVSGITPVDCQASVAADTTFGIAAAGQGGANSAGKQILNARVVTAATQTVAKTGQGTIGDNKIYVTNLSGWFIGGYLSGTGVGAAARISAMDPNGPNGPEVTVSVVNSAAISGTVTLTYNNATIFYNVAHLNRAFAQGAIT
jgi:hypothetical protein